jgi:hypothetical protein
MKWIAALAVAAALLSPFGLATLRADMIPTGPPGRDRPPEYQQKRKGGVNVYVVTGGLITLTGTGSLVAVYAIRRRHGK